MRTLTKEWQKDMELSELNLIFKPFSTRKIPLVFLSGGTECIANEDLNVVTTNLKVSDKENKLCFTLIPDIFEYYPNYFNITTEPDLKSFEDDFFSQYINRLRIISYLPEDILKYVKDKRALALGYAENIVKEKIINFIGDKLERAVEKVECNLKASIKAGKSLSAYKQIKKNDINEIYDNITDIFEEEIIENVECADKNLYINLASELKIVLNNASVVEEEENPVSAYVKAHELYKVNNGYELHFLLRKRDKNFIERYFYVTYKFKDMLLRQ